MSNARQPVTARIPVGSGVGGGETISLPGFDAFRRNGNVLAGYGETGLLLIYRPDDSESKSADRLLEWSRRLRGRMPLGVQATFSYRPENRWQGEAMDMTTLICCNSLLDLVENVLRRPLTISSVLEYDAGSRPLVRPAHLLQAEHPDSRLDFVLSRHADVMADIANRGGVPSSVGWSLLVSQIPRLL